VSAFTRNQQRAIQSEGNVLIEAGAGAGKTRTLVERCVAWLLEGAPNSIDGILMVTFTEAAAAEMRQRIRAELTKKFEERPDDRHLAEQLALLDTAAISTLHSFCFQLVRQNFYELEVDPQLAVMAKEEARLLAEETLTALLQRHYSGGAPSAEAVQQLIQVQGRGWDRPIRRLVLRLHEYSQTLPNPAGWFGLQAAMFGEKEPKQWRTWLEKGLVDWCERWRPILQSEPAENTTAHLCAEILARISGSESASAVADHLSMSPPPHPSQEGNLQPVLQTKFPSSEGPGVGSWLASSSFWNRQLSRIIEAQQRWPRRKGTAFRKRLETFFQEAAFLHSLVCEPEARDNQDAGPAIDPLSEDWNWVCPQMLTLLRLTEDFSRDFSLAKRELGAADFHDLEQFSLRLLWDHSRNRPTRLADHWRKKFKLIFVDEYQDINAAQDALLTALGREGKAANRFLVGDVKQSIYRFRLAAPQIFQDYARKWRNDSSGGEVIPLSDNFRSHEGILNFINPFFASLMRQDIGGVDYDENAWLRFGDREARLSMSIEGDKGSFKPHVEVHLRLTEKKESDHGPENNEDAADSEDSFELSSAEQEARLVGLRLRNLKEQGHQVWDEGQNKHRPVDWRDMVILLRSPSNKVETYAKEFSRLGVPLLATRGGFFESPEVMDLLNLLTLLDNPLQDVPALTVLRSPLVDLSLDELAAIRLAAKGRFWTALRRFHRNGPGSGDRGQQAEVWRQGWEAGGKERGGGAQEAGGAPSIGELRESEKRKVEAGSTASGARLQECVTTAWPKVDLFLRQFAEWRRLARETSLSQCLDRILNDTHYLAWLTAESRGEQRGANVSKLLTWVRQFDQFHRQGLFRFLRFVEAQKDAEIDHDPAPIETENAVRLMSIHQAKGLEFQVVVVANLGKAFNFSDLHESIILDERYGLCPLVKPPFTEQRYPSLPYWLARQRQRREVLGEEMRLLYVAMTRACHTLILTGTSSRNAAEKRWNSEVPASSSLRLQGIRSARNGLDWLGPWLSESTGKGDWIHQSIGECRLFSWAIYQDQDSRIAVDKAGGDSTSKSEPFPGPEDSAAFEALQQRLTWQYPFLSATREPAKVSVSLLRRRINDETMGEYQRPPFTLQPPIPAVSPLSVELTATEIGTAHHIYCQFVSMDCVHSRAALEEEADRMEQAAILSPAERNALKFPWIAAFWTGEIGRRIAAQSRYVNRELPFTARLAFSDLEGLAGQPEGKQENPIARIRSHRNQSKGAELLSKGAASLTALGGEFVVMQGVVDLAVLLPKEIWLLDFKTDLVAADDWNEKAGSYAPQLKLYALAISRIYQRPVTNSWLHFFSIQRTVSCLEL
jgi:ATP-dependent helicase/nuclease subunit A